MWRYIQTSGSLIHFCISANELCLIGYLGRSHGSISAPFGLLRTVPLTPTPPILTSQPQHSVLCQQCQMLNPGVNVRKNRQGLPSWASASIRPGWRAQLLFHRVASASPSCGVGAGWSLAEGIKKVELDPFHPHMRDCLQLDST